MISFLFDIIKMNTYPSLGRKKKNRRVGGKVKKNFFIIDQIFIWMGHIYFLVIFLIAIFNKETKIYIAA